MLMVLDEKGRWKVGLRRCDAAMGRRPEMDFEKEDVVTVVGILL